jgi:hypothetical protein
VLNRVLSADYRSEVARQTGTGSSSKEKTHGSDRSCQNGWTATQTATVGIAGE